MGALQPGHLLLILIIVLIVFGAGRLPETLRDLGRAVRTFREEAEGRAATTTVPSAEQTCASCGARSPAGAKFCAQCGKPL